MFELQAVILGIVEGLTEYLPVSSTGHLILVGNWIGFESAIGRELAATFEIFIQLGAILAVVVAYPRRFTGLLDVRTNQGFSGVRGIGLLLGTSIPALALGALAHDWIKEHLFSPWSVSVGLALGSVWMLWTEWRRPTVRTGGLDEVQWHHAVGIGCFQCIALWPGVSRSAATILGGMILGMDRRTATEYSFFAAVPVLCAAALADVVKNYRLIQASHLALFAIGLVVSFVSALMAVRWLLQYVSHHSLSVFAWYRLALALLVLLVCLMG